MGLIDIKFKKHNLLNLVIAIFVWMILDFLSMSFINEFLLMGSDNEMFLKTARISGYATIIIKVSLIPVFILIVYYITYFISNLLSINLNKVYHIYALTNFTICCIIFSILRILNALIFLDGAYYDPNSINFELLLNNSNWHIFQSNLDFIFLLVSYIVFIFSLNSKNHLSLLNSIKLSLGLLFIILVYNYNLFKNLFNP